MDDQHWPDWPADDPHLDGADTAGLGDHDLAGHDLAGHDPFGHDAAFPPEPGLEHDPGPGDLGPAYLDTADLDTAGLDTTHVDTADLGAGDAAEPPPVETSWPTPPAADLLDYAADTPPAGTDAWQALLDNDEPATSNLARWWAPGE